ncbi:energy transducer TonB [Pseudoroseomonas ludipueritiae]
MIPLAPRGPVLLRGVAVLLAVLLHGAVLAALWPRGRPPPPAIEAVPVTLSGMTGEAEEGSGAPPAPSAPVRESLPSQPAPEPAVPAAPDLAEPVLSEPALAEAMPPVPPAPAELPLPLPPPPAPPQQAAAASPPATPTRPPMPPAPPPQPVAPGQVRLGAGTALDIAPGAETRAARPRDLACSDSIDYPPELRQAGIGGEVVLRLRLTDKGRVIEAKLAESSGHPQLDEAVQRSVRRCRFDPALRGGVPVWSNLTFRATLRPY